MPSVITSYSIHYTKLYDAEHGNKTGALRSRKLAHHDSIRFAVETPPLGMPNQHMRASKISEHRRRYLAGKRPFGILAEILRPQGNPGSGESYNFV